MATGEIQLHNPQVKHCQTRKWRTWLWPQMTEYLHNGDAKYDYTPMTFCMWIYISLYHAAIFLPRSFSGPGTSGWYANIYPGQPKKRHLPFQWSLSLLSGVYNVGDAWNSEWGCATALSSWGQKISLGIAKMACRDSIWFFENHLLSYAIIICRRKHRVSSHWTWLVYLFKQPDADHNSGHFFETSIRSWSAYPLPNRQHLSIRRVCRFISLAIL